MADQWTTVDEGAATMITFDVIGDVLDADYIGPEVITDPNTQDQWNQYLFRATASSGDSFTPGELLGVTGTYALDRAMEKVPQGARTRLEYVKDVPTNKGNPMKSFKVQYIAAK